MSAIQITEIFYMYNEFHYMNERKKNTTDSYTKHRKGEYLGRNYYGVREISQMPNFLTI